jgi:NADPH-dependent 2,4-dienoyl-CoA reductase/sulfur reductase-like enzyme/nitrite reductase/ring-hydroxylating ferredoxin subunit
MSEQAPAVTGPDLAAGIAVAGVSEGRLLAGHVGEEAVLLTRRGNEWFAIGAVCSHYNGPLPEGLMVGDTVRCPWHHACFSLRTGQALRPPALNDVPCWEVEQKGEMVFVRGKRPRSGAQLVSRSSALRSPESVVIVGAGAAGNSAAETLRREGYQGPITLFDPDPDAPYDRPNLSKDYLAGSAPEDWIPLHPPEFYAERDIHIVRNLRVAGLDLGQHRIRLDDGSTYPYGALLLATGATPVRLPQGNSSILYLRTLRDSKAIIAASASARRVIILGASFIGLEVAASLRARKLEVHVVAPDRRPLERVMGPELGDFIRKLHEEHGVNFHLQQTAKEFAPGEVVLENGQRLKADLIVAGIGVRPNLELAEQAGLALDRGVAVNQFLQTSVPDVFAAGDIARWPDPHTGERIRVEHWVVAQRQGQAAARNMLGQQLAFDAVPFFWSQHYDVPINYVGHAERWDRLQIDGDIDARDSSIQFIRADKVLATATIYRDRQSLELEAEMELSAGAVVEGAR